MIPSRSPLSATVSIAAPLDAAWLRELCLAAGADDVGFVEVGRDALAQERPYLEAAFPPTRSLISLVVRMNRENIRSPARSLANKEFHLSGDEAEQVARRVVQTLESKGIRALYPPVGFPMEADKWMTERLWVVAHKPVAVAAGLGHMGLNRNVIHPQFGNFILLATILLDADISAYGRELDYNPCLSCKLCVAACPVGAISPDGHFNSTACLTHNYAEFLGGFSNWVETVADSRNGLHYRQRVKESETISLWQSLALGPNYKAAYCLAVCPAGEDVIDRYRNSKTEFIHESLRPLQQKVEPVYVVPGSDAEKFVQHRYPHKQVRHVRSPVRPANLKTFIQGMRIGFQREAAGSLRAVFHFVFCGQESGSYTVTISDQRLLVEPGLQGHADLRVTADTASWLKFLRRETSIVKEILLRRIRVKGPLKLLRSFGQCFPS